MPLCGSSFCGCAVASVPADFAEIDGAFPTIDVDGNGTGASPWNLTLNDEWASAVADLVNNVPKRIAFGTATGTTNASGTLSFNHGLAWTPSAVSIAPVAPNGVATSDRFVSYGGVAANSTVITVGRCINQAAAVLATVSVTVMWIAVA